MESVRRLYVEKKEKAEQEHSQRACADDCSLSPCVFSLHTDSFYVWNTARARKLTKQCITLIISQ